MSTQSVPNTRLYQAQETSIDVMAPSWFPCYSPEYVQSQEGLKGKLIWCYSKGYNVINFFSPLVTAVNYVGSKLFSGADFMLGWAIRPIADAVYPINPVNGQRHFVAVPRSVEKFLGDWIFYPLVTDGMRETNELMPNSNVRIAEKVDHVFKRLLNANTELLNPQDEKTKFNYRVKTIHSSDLNAFAVPAGGMVVFSQLVKEIDGAIKSKKIKESTIKFADGSTATVDLSNVTLEDTIASLMGHEMTHAASRHSIVALVGQFFRSILLSIGRFALITYLKGIDPEYRDLIARKGNLQDHEKRALEHKEKGYEKMSSVFKWIGDQISNLTSLFNSKKNEYEADTTGAYFASQANFNPLGAIYLQEVLNGKGELSDFLHKHFEFAFTHPYVENRKRAVFAAIQKIQPQTLKERTQWKIADSGYDLNRSDKAIQYAFRTSLQ